MKTLISTIFFCLVFVSPGCKSTTKQTQENDEINLEKVKARFKEFSELISSRDSAKFYAYLPNYVGNNAEIIPAGSEPVIGDKIIPWYHTYFGPYFSAFKSTGSVSNEEYYLGGDWAIHRYSYKFFIILKENAEPIVEIGNGIHIYHRDSDGSWKLSKDIWSIPTP
jgi:ketosteroid isomerase-like protein